MINAEFSGHAQKAMEEDDISRDDVCQCLGHGKLEIKQIVGKETRYGKQLDLKDKKIMVIYTIREEKIRIITAYTIQRKRTWQN